MSRFGSSIVILKTHYDILAGWDYDPQTGTSAKLGSLARKHGFLIFEVRNFGDSGHTVQMQYTAGSARAQDMSQRRSFIAAHNMLRVLAFGANMLSYSGQSTADEPLVRM
ncbi:uncharacterized protein PG998_014686 [Apiospora kogelbergensis]|uniref:uncharacterized protein n=1 Tax=Apiospora kogelbergensis TaxID=1337665 RepID=UPI0031324D8F